MWIKRSPVRAGEAVPPHIAGVAPIKLAAISDIHGNIDALNAVLADIERRGVDRIVNLGDSLSGPFDAVATADRLMALDVPTVSGNHDRQLIDRPKSKMSPWEAWAIDDLSETHLDWLRALPKTLALGDVFLCHATPEKDDENWLDRRGPDARPVARDLVGVLERAGNVDAELILCGHTHTPRSVQLPDGRRIVNPGSVGCPGYFDTRFDPPFVHQTGSSDARYAIAEKRGAVWHVDHLSVPYDTSEMARLATAKGADNWVKAITTAWYT